MLSAYNPDNYCSPQLAKIGSCIVWLYLVLNTEQKKVVSFYRDASAKEFDCFDCFDCFDILRL